MRIGFDAKRAAQNRTGLGNYSRFVLRILSQRGGGDELHLYIPNPRRTPFLGEIPTLAALRLHYPCGPVWRLLGSLWRVAGVWRDIRRDGMALYHGLSNELPLGIRRAGCRSVVTIHDLIFLHCPEYYHPVDRLIYNYKFRRACRVADRVVAVSEFTKRELMRYYGVPEAKIDVVYQGCDPAFAAPIARATLDDVRSRYSLPPRFVLYVGSIERRKNLGLVAEAACLMARRGRKAGEAVPVIAVGRHTSYEDELRTYLRGQGAEGAIRFVHGVPFADLPSFYRLATAFVYPSRIEGFGIPLLEAATSGVPAIGCTGSCLEEAGGPGAIYVDPDDAEAMADAMHTACTDGPRRQRMIAEGRAHAARFNDRRLADELMEVYRKALAGANEPPQPRR